VSVRSPQSFEEGANQCTGNSDQILVVFLSLIRRQSVKNPNSLHAAQTLIETLTVRSASQESFHLLWNQKVHCRVNMLSPPVHSLSQMNQIHIFKPHFPKLHFLIVSSHLRLDPPSGLFPFGFATKILYTLSSPVCVLHGPHLILLDLIVLTFCEQ
jgi:hypothetical protein